MIKCEGLARFIHTYIHTYILHIYDIRYVYGVFGRKITKCTVIYGVSGMGHTA
jgi:hypothetical protein